MVGIASVTRISCGHPGPGFQINPLLPPAWNCTLSTRDCSFLHRTLVISLRFCLLEEMEIMMFILLPFSCLIFKCLNFTSNDFILSHLFHFLGMLSCGAYGGATSL